MNKETTYRHLFEALSKNVRNRVNMNMKVCGDGRCDIRPCLRMGFVRQVVLKKIFTAEVGTCVALRMGNIVPLVHVNLNGLVSSFDCRLTFDLSAQQGGRLMLSVTSATGNTFNGFEALMTFP